ncbi:hypothetical protein CYY_000061 [Polysphondylium violaceum]|uniref:G-protein-coupled receptor family protein n=1 Tax=Polysphondylium violaceum TaxID=133409 RepID=A0A8J4V2S4_9MYCE|nr:hypothetical protein CYY_000061 [Polysphondylium violaceum]
MKDIILIYLICAPLSIIASAFIIISWGVFAKLKHSGSNFIFFQSISDFIFTLKYVATIIIYYTSDINQFDDGEVSNSALCFSIGVWGQFFGQATVMWSFMMTVKVFLQMMRQNQKQYQQQLDKHKPQQVNNTKGTAAKEISTIKYYHLFVWGFCAVNAAIIGAFKQYGPSSNGCWIIGGTNPFRLFELVPLYITISTSIVIMIIILARMKRNRPTSLLPTESVRYKQQEAEFRNQLLKFIFVFVLFWTPPTILRTLEFFEIEAKPFIILDAISVSLQACANSLIWGTSKNFVKLLKRKVRRSKTQNAYLEREYLINK